jgi:hypothetical protein
MVLHVLADAAQVMDDRDADAPEMLGIANPDNCSMCGEPIGRPTGSPRVSPRLSRGPCGDRRARIGWSGQSYPVRSGLARRNPVDDAFANHNHCRVGTT